MKILVAHNYYKMRGGEDVVAEDECDLLRHNGHNVLLYTKSNDDIVQKFNLVQGLSSLWSIKTYKEILELIRSFNPDIIHVHNTLPIISPSIVSAAYKMNVPIVCTLHNYRYSCLSALLMRDGKICESCIKGNFFPGIINRCYRDSYFDSAMLAIIQWASRFFKVIPDKVSKFVALTEFAKSKYIEMGIPSSKIRIKPNFTKDYANSTQDVLNEGLYVGRLSKEKGIDVLVQAIELVPNFTLHVVGDGPLMGLVENHPQIQYYGWQDQSIISQLMATCSFLIMPSMWYEGLPRTLIEAYAHGLPIISSRIGSLKDLIDDGKTGYLFEPGDSISLARLIESALTNQEKMLSFRKNCVELYKSHFSAKVNYKILINIYANTIAERS